LETDRSIELSFILPCVNQGMYLYNPVFALFKLLVLMLVPNTIFNVFEPQKIIHVNFISSTCKISLDFQDNVHVNTLEWSLVVYQ